MTRKSQNIKKCGVAPEFCTVLHAMNETKKKQHFIMSPDGLVKQKINLNCDVRLFYPINVRFLGTGSFRIQFD